ncbi:hypothetical protein [Oceanobacillus massiliensis]|uniref:hypothetical protein n=1 Tax=Oceanobacillus massiliensis TaxID=1465765 RepID=UPI000287B421|nr:hypothetical protein [Oceanobacillus massiliensis]
MSRTDNEQQELIQNIQELPVIKDNTEKIALYNRISSAVSNDKKNKGKTSKFIPASATLIAVALLIFIPFILFQNMPANEENQNADMQMADTYSESKEATESGIMNRIEEDSSSNAAGQAVEQEQSNRIAEVPMESYVLNENDDRMKVVHGAGSDIQQQYVIPISFLIADNENLHEYYNKLDRYMKNDEWGLNEYMLKGVTFELKKSEVLINLGEEFSIGEGSSNANIFAEMLTAMFTPYGINKAVLHSKDNNGVDLGPYGTIQEIPLQETKTVYKLYNRQFLLPVSDSEDLTIDQAFSEMRNDQKEFNINRTIPDDIQFTTKVTGNTLVITFQEGDRIENGQEELTMIEAMLMTAKSYGYEYVQFTNAPIDQIGHYYLPEPISVPAAVNPIDLRD